ncbi:MAG: hypothetical protein K0U36_05000 [Alphaproteobacteria bacterium]|nr:hypothetical protein [Alphaproteobacteria bacterium]
MTHPNTPFRTPLYAWHAAQGAKLVDFAGWDMPISYPHGSVAEHMACHEGCAVFDVSHMLLQRFSGADAEKLLAMASTVEPVSLAAGRAKYGLLLSEQGAVIDDAIITRDPQGGLKMVSNASRASQVSALLAETISRHGYAVQLTALGGVPSATTAMIAVQGKNARSIVANLMDDSALRAVIHALTFTRVASVEASLGDKESNNSQASKQVPLEVSCLGYTGCDGFEIECPAESAPILMDALCKAGAIPAGLAARNTLRLEAGLPLYGHELTEDIAVSTAGLGWTIGRARRSNQDFNGADTIVPQLDAPSRLFGVRAQGRAPLRDDDELVFVVETPSESVVVPIGHLTSGGFSPLLDGGIGIGIAHTEPALAQDSLPTTPAIPEWLRNNAVPPLGTQLTMRRGKRTLPVMVVGLPFVPPSQFRG